jgi:hypothetical protein
MEVKTLAHRIELGVSQDKRTHVLRSIDSNRRTGLGI